MADYDDLAGNQPWARGCVPHRGRGKAQVVRDVFVGAYDPEGKPSQLIRPASGRLDLLLDAAAAKMLPDAAGETLELT